MLLQATGLAPGAFWWRLSPVVDVWLSPGSRRREPAGQRFEVA
jgi:hypothetical protein